MDETSGPVIAGKIGLAGEVMLTAECMAALTAEEPPQFDNVLRVAAVGGMPGLREHEGEWLALLHPGRGVLLRRTGAPMLVLTPAAVEIRFSGLGVTTNDFPKMTVTAGGTVVKDISLGSPMTAFIAMAAWAARSRDEFEKMRVAVRTIGLVEERKELSGRAGLLLHQVVSGQDVRTFLSWPLPYPHVAEGLRLLKQNAAEWAEFKSALVMLNPNPAEVLKLHGVTDAVMIGELAAAGKSAQWKTWIILGIIAALLIFIYVMIHQMS